VEDGSGQSRHGWIHLDKICKKWVSVAVALPLMVSVASDCTRGDSLSPMLDFICRYLMMKLNGLDRAVPRICFSEVRSVLLYGKIIYITSSCRVSYSDL